jgi:16S rRNA (adenine1518-N6/adenine1519-N6)-dimethyltransferase
MLSLREIKSILKEYNIRLSKRLGQSFLIDKNIQGKIIEALQLQKEDTVLEIGPGLGTLTEELCRNAKKVIAIEKDKRLYDFLSENLEFNNLELVHGDILKFGAWRQFSAVHRLKIVGNLPYYISSPILIKLIENRNFISSALISVQKEFGERLTSIPGTKAYGSISCFVQFYTEPDIIFTIKKGSFYPVPKVDSCFLKIKIRERPLFATDEEKLFRIIRACFGKRRKTILNSLYSSKLFASKEKILEGLKKAGISPERRPETISLSEFVNLADALVY